MRSTIEKYDGFLSFDLSERIFYVLIKLTEIQFANALIQVGNHAFAFI